MSSEDSKRDRRRPAFSAFADREFAARAGRKGGSVRSGLSSATDSDVPSRPGKVSDLDRLLGERVRSRRHQIDQNQEDLAAALGISSVMLGKYESGRNRISAVMLWRIAHHQGCPIEHYYQGLPAAGKESTD